MKYKALSALIVLCSIAIIYGCSRNKEIIGSGKVVSETRNVQEFDQIVLNGEGNLLLSPEDKPGLRIEGEDNIINLITSQVEDGILKLKYQKDGAARNIKATKPINIYVQVTSLKEIHLSGSGNISNTKPLNIQTLKLSISGSGKTDMNLTGKKLISLLSGSGKFIMKGNVEDQEISISGSGLYQAEGLVSKTAHINITGAAQVFVNVKDDLDVRISGLGTVIYQGSPQIHQSISGTGKIQQATEEEPQSAPSKSML